MVRIFSLFFLLLFSLAESHPVSLGVDVFFDKKFSETLKGKKVGLVMNQTSVDGQMRSLLERFQELEGVQIAALFSPEHGLKGQHYAWEKVAHQTMQGIPVYSLHGETRRAKPEMLQGLDVLIYDIQWTGVRAYTYLTTLFYLMEESAKRNIEVIVLDRPNPINGLIVDGPLLEEKWRSYIGYVNVPYCHGMTNAELAQFFNEEYHVGCKLRVIPMEGWKRSMSYRDTGLVWIPPSPNVPEADTPLYCPMTGILGEVSVVNIGIGFSLPFRLAGAPWIKANEFAEKLNGQKLPGVHFQPFHFRPFWGLYKGIDCEGVLIHVTDLQKYRPLSVQYLLLGMLKSLYPQEFLKRFKNSASAKDLFCKANGTEEIYNILVEEKYPAWKLIEFQKEEREQFLETRKKYLLPYPP